jgi:hypothetical protein
MKVLASYLAVMLAASPARAAAAPPAAADAVEADTFTVVAPRLKTDETAALRRARAGGAGTAAAGAGLLAYVVFAGTGPFGWAAALLFLGGGTAYLAHRRLAGNDDFGPTPAKSRAYNGRGPALGVPSSTRGQPSS